MPSGEKPEPTPQPYDDLKEHLRSKDRDRAIELYYQLLSSGRPLNEIIAAGVEPSDGAGAETIHQSPSDLLVHPPPPPTTTLLVKKPDPTQDLSSSVGFDPGSRPLLQSIPELLVGRGAFTDGDRIKPNGAFNLEQPPTTPQTETPPKEHQVHSALNPDTARRAMRVIVLSLCGGIVLGSTVIGGLAILHRTPSGANLISPGGLPVTNDSGPIANAPERATNQVDLPARSTGSQSEPTATNIETVTPSDTSSTASIPRANPIEVATQEHAAPPPSEVAPKASTEPAPGIPVGQANVATTANTASEKQRLQQSEVEAVLARGDSLFTAGDVTGARLFYQYVADAGDASGALRLGETFDPLFLQQARLPQIRGDVTTAVYWYTRASELGSADAKLLLNLVTELEK